MDKIKGFYSLDGVNYHIRIDTTAIKEDGTEEKVWIYAVTDHIVSAYETIEQIEYGLWNKSDEKLKEFIKKVEAEAMEENPDKEEEE
jgi:hypothetical protein